MTDIVLEQLASHPRDDGFAVTGIDLHVAPGTVCALVGPSGSGKTTLLRLVAGIEPVASGTVRLGDDDVTTWPARDRELAWFAGEHPLYPHMDVEHNIGFALRVRRWFRRRDHTERVEAEARAAGVEGLLPRMPPTLSAGEQQAAGLARTRVRLPRAYLLDEPLANIDPQQRSRLRAELQTFLRALGAPAIVATNDQEDALSLADQLAVVRDGQLVQVGASQELWERPDEAFVATFLNPTQMNLLPGRLEAGGRSTWVRVGAHAAVELPAVPARLRAALDDRPVCLGLRANDLHVRRDADAPAGFAVVVERVEPLGYAAIVHARLDDDLRLAVLVKSPRDVSVGETVRVVAAPRGAHLFAADTGRALWHAGAA